MELVFQILFEVLFIKAIRRGLQHVGAAVKYMLYIKRRPYSLFLKQPGNELLGLAVLTGLFLLCLGFSM